MCVVFSYYEDPPGQLRLTDVPATTPVRLFRDDLFDSDPIDAGDINVDELIQPKMEPPFRFV